MNNELFASIHILDFLYQFFFYIFCFWGVCVCGQPHPPVLSGLTPALLRDHAWQVLGAGDQTQPGHM